MPRRCNVAESCVPISSITPRVMRCQYQRSSSSIDTTARLIRLLGPGGEDGETAGDGDQVGHDPRPPGRLQEKDGLLGPPREHATRMHTGTGALFRKRRSALADEGGRSGPLPRCLDPAGGRGRGVGLSGGDGSNCGPSFLCLPDAPWALTRIESCSIRRGSEGAQARGGKDGGSSRRPPGRSRGSGERLLGIPITRRHALLPHLIDDGRRRGVVA